MRLGKAETRQVKVAGERGHKTQIRRVTFGGRYKTKFVQVAVAAKNKSTEIECIRLLGFQLLLTSLKNLLIMTNILQFLLVVTSLKLLCNIFPEDSRVLEMFPIVENKVG